MSARNVTPSRIFAGTSRSTMISYGPAARAGAPQITVDTRNPSKLNRSRCASMIFSTGAHTRSEEHTSELQSRLHLVCRLLLEKKKKYNKYKTDRNCMYNTSVD